MPSQWSRRWSRCGRARWRRPLRGLRTIAPGRRNLLAAFTVGVGEVAAECGLGLETVSAVLDAFVLRGGDADFATASDFNAAAATPLIEVGVGRYLLFQNYTLAEAVYTAPSYWDGGGQTLPRHSQ